MIDIPLGLAFVAGLLSFLSPCVLPLVPAYIGYMGGRMTLAAAQTTGGTLVQVSTMTRISTFLHGVAFVAGFTTVFVALGLLTTAFIGIVNGQDIRLFTDILARVGGTFLVLLGLQMLGVVQHFAKWLNARPSLMNSPASTIALAVVAGIVLTWAFIQPLLGIVLTLVLIGWLWMSNAFAQPGAFWQRLFTRLNAAFYADTRKQINPNEQHGFAGSYFMGVVFSAGWTPCIGPIYGGILTMAASGGSVTAAGTQLFAYSLGLGIPFLLAALMLDGAQVFLRRLQRHMRTIKLVSGALLLIIGVAVASGTVQEISRNFAGQFADFSYQLEDCALSVFEGDLPIGEFGDCMNATALTPDEQA
jgi:cytochrome c-type biogenesis protein